MGDESIVLYDETSPLEQTRKSILYYNPRPEETTTYLVELPEKRIDAPRPSTASRRRKSTIINTSQLPDTREAEEQPLEHYVWRNLPSFRKSLNPEEVQRLTSERPAREGYEGGEVVRPATAEDIERDLMDRKKGKNRDSGTVERYEQRDRLSEEKGPKNRMTYRSANSSEPNTRKRRDSIKLEDSQRNDAEKAKQKYVNPSANKKYEHAQPSNDVVVMPALEPVSVSQKSPFSRAQNFSFSPSKNRPPSPIKVEVSIESFDEERLEDEKRGGKHRSKKSKNSSLSAKRKNSRESDENSNEEDNESERKKSKKRKHRQKSELSSKDSEEPKDRDEENRKRRKRLKEKSEEAKRGRNESKDSSRKLRRNRSRSSSLCLSGESGDDSSEPNIVNRSSKKENHREVVPSDKNKKHSIEHKAPSKDKKVSPPSSAKQNKKPDDFVGYSKRTNPFGKEEPYSVNYVATEGAEGKKPDASSEKGKPKKKEKEKRGGEDPDKALSVKAPRSATRVVAKRRYHIQIPEPGQRETWFNVRFNMNAENNVDMNYEGPVKINNYYASNNYS